MIIVVERATGAQFKAEKIEGGYKIYTLVGEEYKKLKDSTFAKYFKKTGASSRAGAEEKTEERKSSKIDPNRGKTPSATRNIANPKKGANSPEISPITPEKRQAMIEKIQKMMALAKNNSSREESLAAALKAQELMVKYNIHQEDVELEEVKDEIISVFSAQTDYHLKKWRRSLAVIVAGAFRCKAYMSGKNVVFRGYRDDAQLALEVYLGLYYTGHKLAKKAKLSQYDETGSGKGAYNSVALGFLHGVKDAFDAQCTALLVITPKEVEEDWNSFSANMRKSSARIKGTNSELYAEGYAEGKKAVKSRSIESHEPVEKKAGKSSKAHKPVEDSDWEDE